MKTLNSLKFLFPVVLMASGITGVTGCATVRDGRGGMELEESTFPDPLGLGADRAASARSKQRMADACMELVRTAKVQMTAQTAFGQVGASQNPGTSFRCGDGYIEVGGNGQMMLNRPGYPAMPISAMGYQGPAMGSTVMPVGMVMPVGQGFAPPHMVASNALAQQTGNQDGFYTPAEFAEYQRLTNKWAACESDSRIRTSDTCQNIIASHTNFRRMVEAKRQLEAQDKLRALAEDGEPSGVGNSTGNGRPDTVGTPPPDPPKPAGKPQASRAEEPKKDEESTRVAVAARERLVPSLGRPR